MIFAPIRNGGIKTLICECGEIIKGSTFRDYIRTTAGPSTSTIGHHKCGYIFNFIDDRMPKKYSSRKELKSLAVRFAQKNKMESRAVEKFLIEVDRLKSSGNKSDYDILLEAFKRL